MKKERGSAQRAISEMWRRYLAAPLPRMWLGPFDGRVLRGARPVESLILLGEPGIGASPRYWQVKGGRRRRVDGPPLQVVQERAAALGLRALGWVSYEVAGLLERLPPAPGPPTTWPLLRFDFFTDEECLALDGTEDASFWPTQPDDVAQAAKLLPTQPAGSYEAQVRRIRAWIRRGDCYQVNIVQPFEALMGHRPASALFAALRRQDPSGSGYRALIEPARGRAIISDSPELFLRRTGDLLEAEPIKGTARRPESGRSPVSPHRGDTHASPASAVTSLLASSKDRAELAMITDLMRNDLSRVCRPGSVEVAAFPEIMLLPALVHTRSRIRGRLEPGTDLQDCFQAAFPSGSITGCPRIRAMERIAQLEATPRGPCMGAIGWVDPAGDFCFSVAIRTALLEKGRLTLLAGGGITIDSRPQAEEEESRLKTEGFRRALGALQES